MEVQKLFDVSGKVVVVTGGGRGIGLMISEGFVRNGAKVYIVSRNKQVCDKVAKGLNDIGSGQCLSIPTDLQDYDQVKALAQELEKREPQGIDILINNSGANWGASVEEYPDKAFTKVVNLNLQRVFTLTQLCIPLLKKKATQADPARVINIGSIDGIRTPFTPTYAYSASKAGLHQMTRVLAADLGDSNITVNAVAPGPFESKMMKATLDSNYNRIVKGIPLRRIGDPDDMAGVCIYLSSKAGSYVNGTIIPVDGGTLVANREYNTSSKL